MKMNKIDVIQSLHKVFVHEKPQKEHFDTFKQNLHTFFENVNENETEENLKNDLILFLNSFYNQDYYINTKERADLVIHTDKSPKSNAGVIFEMKHPSNKTQMITNENMNCKGFQQLVLYFLRERINNKNIDIKHLILTNIYDWYIFDATEFEKIFYKNNDFVTQFIEWQLRQKTSDNTELFYNEIAKPFIDNNVDKISCTYFNLLDFKNQTADSQLIPLYKILSPFHLLKQAFKNDSNTLNTQFYYELLHIIGLEEQTENGTRLLKRCKQPEHGSLLENTINRIKFYNNINEIENIETYGNEPDDKIFGLALELCIVWLNRILFLKLLEAQLIQFHNGDKTFNFLNSEKIKSYSKLDNLFFDVLAVKKENRSEQVKKNYDHIPYLNSSLFEATKLEKKLFLVGTLDNDTTLNYFKSTILKDAKGNKKTGEVPALHYLLEFLGAYNFGSDSANELQIDDKTLINSSVLGLIFEKINGYKEGSFYTPGYITMYICRETVRRAVVEEFNKKYNWNCKYEENLIELYNKIAKISIKEANDVINSITICDPAVGSGHFLVSALNEMIAVKADLDILIDRQGKLLKDYLIKIENDELIIKDTEGNYFQYTLFNGVYFSKNTDLNKEKQRVQEAIFHEKKYIIENCLFGVDINQNSVNITRLRLWIELLKNAYYKLISNEGSSYLELQTLPNIDINIKCGNSLIHRFALNTDLSKILKSIKYDINYFKSCVQNYKHAENKELKKGYEKSIEQIKADFKVQIRRLDPRQIKLNQLKEELHDRFLSPKLLQQDFTEEQKKKINEEREKLLHQIVQLENEIADELSGVMYQNAFEWRFEFPEILDSVSGEFLGFHIVVGNPPYIDHKKLAKYSNFISKRYTTYSSTGDISIYFFELGNDLLKNRGFLNYISTNKFFRTEYGKKCRDVLTKNQIHYIVNFEQVPIFKEALVSSTIICTQKTANDFDFPFAEFTKEPAPDKNFAIEIKKRNKYFNGTNLNSRVWSFAADSVQKIKAIIESKGKPMKDIESIEIFRGVTTGFDDAFIINQDTYNELISKDEKNKKIIKPLLKGKDIKKYFYKFDNLFLIFSRRNLKIEEYPTIEKYLLQFKEQLTPREEQSKIGRKPGDYKWYDIQDNTAYYPYFEFDKIIWALTADKYGFTLDTQKFFLTSGGFLLVSKTISLKYILAILNSNLMRFYFSQIGVMTAGGAYTLKKATIERFPLIELTENEQQPFIKLVDKILDNKFKNIDTTEFENEVDKMVYNLYNITDDEVQIMNSLK